MTARITRFVLAAALVGSLPGGVAYAQTAGHGHEHHSPQPPAATTAPPAASMMAMMRAQQKKLDELAATLARMTSEMKTHCDMMKTTPPEAVPAPGYLLDTPMPQSERYGSRNPH